MDSMEEFDQIESDDIAYLWKGESLLDTCRHHDYQGQS